MPAFPSIVTVSLNPAIDRVIEVKDFALGAHQVGRELRRTPGGKGVNVSRVLAALGVANVATGFLGRKNPSAFAALLEDPTVADEFFRLPGRTRENVTIVDPVAGQETHIRDAGLSVDARDLERLAKKLRLLARPDGIVVFAGSLPPGVSQKDFSHLIGACQKAGARVAVNSSGKALQGVADKMLWLLAINAAELAELVGRDLGDSDAQFAAARALESRFEIVLLTCGAEGACMATGGRAWRGRVQVDAAIRNTVGCGDALLGAFLAGVVKGKPLPDAFAEAVACATAAAFSLIPGTFEAELFEKFKNAVELTEL